jgi:hypothetical protein
MLRVNRALAVRAGIARSLGKTGASSAQAMQVPDWICVTITLKLTSMEKTQVYLRKEELAALREAAARSGRSVAELVREAVRRAVLRPQAEGPVALWDGEPKRTSVEHDSVHDEP